MLLFSHPAEVLPKPPLAKPLGDGQETADALSGVCHQFVVDQIRKAALGVHVKLVYPPLCSFLRDEYTTKEAWKLETRGRDKGKIS